jgi:outer membrane immunogenic protein
MPGVECESLGGLEMHRLAIVGAGLFSIAGFIGGASAADLAARPYTKAPPIAEAVYNWTGFYIGANGGYGWGKTTSVDTVIGTSSTHNPSGALAGGQIGYNWQAGSWVFGLEADGDWANIRGSAPCPNPAFGCASNTRALASFRGRIGYAAGPVLFYGTGGVGYANTNYNEFSVGGAIPPAGASAFYSTDRWGYAVGAGIEYGFTPNWSAKLEYMHYGFDSVTAPPGTLSVGTPVSLSLRVDTIKVGINYRFGGPIVARY